MGKSVRAALWPGKGGRQTQQAPSAAISVKPEAAHTAAYAHIKQRGSARLEAALQSLQLHALERSDAQGDSPAVSAGGPNTAWHSALPAAAAAIAVQVRELDASRSISGTAGRSTAATAGTCPAASSAHSSGGSSASPVAQDGAVGLPDSRDRRPRHPTGADSEEDCATSARVASPTPPDQPGTANRVRGSALRTGHAAGVPAPGSFQEASKAPPSVPFLYKQQFDGAGRALRPPSAPLGSAAPAEALQSRRPAPVVMFAASAEPAEAQIKAFTPSQWRWGSRDAIPKQVGRTLRDGLDSTAFS